jgi:hypothetical protein
MIAIPFIGTTNSGGTVTISKSLPSPMRLVLIRWQLAGLSAGVDVVIKATGSSEVAGAAGVTQASLDRTLATLTDANADAWYTPDTNPIADRDVTLTITSGGNAKTGGAILYFDETASASGGGGGSGDASAANQTTLNSSIGATTDAAATAGSTGSVNAKLRLGTTLWDAISTTLTSILATAGAVADAAVTAGATGSISAKLRSISRDIIANIVLAAGENFIGKVGGTTNVVQVPLTVSTSPAYTSADLIGGKITIANAVRVSGGTGTLASIQILDRANQKPTGTIYIFNADPTAGTYTDNAAPSVSTDDLKVIGQIAVNTGDYVTTNVKAFGKLAFNPIPVKAASGTSLYAIFQTTSTPTFAATTDVQLSFGFLQD